MDTLRHDPDLSRPVQVFTLCPKCANEVEVPAHANNAGVYCTVSTCPKCSARIDTWVRIAIGARPVATINAAPDASPATLSVLEEMVNLITKQRPV